jgi:hypothetical protein
MGRPEFLEINRTTAMMQPAHDKPVSTNDLLPINSNVETFLVRPLCYDQSKGDQLAGIIWPAGLDGEHGQIDIFSLNDYFLT